MIMNKVQEIDRLINGYANGLITDDELEFMLDILGALETFNTKEK